MPARKYDKTEDYEPKASERISDFIDTSSPEYVWPENPSAILLKFKDKIHWVYEPGLRAGLCHGEILQMININFGFYRGNEIPWGRMAEVREWLINNLFRNFQLLSPDYHNQLMQFDNPYSQDFRRQEKAISNSRTEW